MGAQSSNASTLMTRSMPKQRRDRIIPQATRAIMRICGESNASSIFAGIIGISGFYVDLNRRFCKEDPEAPEASQRILRGRHL